MDHNNSLGPIIHRFIRKYIAIPKREMDKYGKHFEALYSTVFEVLRALNEDLDMLIVDYSLEGSTGDKLKVAKPNEFDLVFKLQIPYYESIVVSRDPQIPGNVLLDLSRVLELLAIDSREDRRRVRKLLLQLVDGGNLLIVDKLRHWLQSLFSRALNRMEHKFEVEGSMSQLRYKTCGPAHTIFVDGQLEYSVDFVPAIRLEARQHVLPSDPSVFFICSELPYWDAIPKPLKTPFPVASPSFRSSFYDAEKEMLRDKHRNCRDAIKLMKKFRDVKTNLSHLKSYYIKTLFLWKIRHTRKSYWQKPLTVILIDMFDELTECLRQGRIAFFWDPELNMLDVLSGDQVTELYRCVRGILETLRRMAETLSPRTLIVVHSAFSHKEERTKLRCSLQTASRKQRTIKRLS